MKTLRLGIALTLVFIVATGISNAQAVGDYGSAGTGTWGTTGANWLVCQTPGTWGDAIAAPGAPASTNDVWIRAGHTVTIEASGKTCNNITIESGASLIGANTLPTSSLRYFRVYGTTVANYGTIGSSIDCLGMQPYGGASQVITITGGGTTYLSRIQPQTSGQAVIFDTDVQMDYAGSSGSGSTALYCANGDFSVTINAGKTVTMSRYSYVSAHTSSGSSAGNANFTLDIYGTLTTGNNAHINLNNSTGKTSTLTIHNGGAVNLGDSANMRADVSGPTYALAVNSGGTLTGGNVTNGQFNLAQATLTVDGTVDFNGTSTSTRALGTAVVNAGGKLRMKDGTYPSGTITLNSGSTVEYYGSSSISLGASPAVYADLQISNSAGVTLGGNAQVDGTLLLQGGNLSTAGYTMAISSTGSVSKTSGYVNGNLEKNFGTGANVSETFEIGDATTYTPVDITFANVSGAGDVTASTTAGDHPNIGTSSVNASKSVNRYWTLANSGVTFDSYDATFTFDPGDVDGGADPSKFIANKYDGSWSNLTVGTKTATTTQVTGATSFSDFAIGELTGPQFELSAASLNFGGVVIFTSKEDSLFLRNIGTVDLHVDSVTSDNPRFAGSAAGSTITPGDSTKVTLTFSPNAISYESGNIIFYHDAVTSPDSLPVSGTGIGTPPIVSNGTGGGDWNVGTTWIGGVVPSGSDSAMIQAGDSVYMLAAGSCTGMSMQAGAKLALNASSLTIPGSAWTFSTTSTVYYNNTTTVQSGPAYGNLTYATSSSGNCNGDLTVNGDLNITASTLRGNAGTSGSFTHTVAGNVIVGPGTSARITAVNNSSATSASCTWNIAGNLQLTGNNSNNRMIFYESGGPHTGSAAFSIGGNLEIGTGSQIMFKSSSSTTSDYPEGVLDLKGDLVQGGTIGINSATTGNSLGLTINLNGSSPQTWSGTGGFSVSAFLVTVNIDNAAGVSLGSARTLGANVALGLVNGLFKTTNANLLTVTTGILLGGSSSSYVDGPLARSTGVGAANPTFPIGDSSAYTPVTFQFGTVSTAGTLTGSTTAGDHPELGSSAIYAPLSLNRYYTFTNAGIVFDTYDAVFNFVPSDLDGGADPLAFIGQKYDGSWSDLTEGTKTDTSIQITGSTSFSDFAFGQLGPSTILSNGTGGGAWTNAATWQGGVVPSSIDSVVILASDSVDVPTNKSCSGLLVQAGGKLSLAAQLTLTNIDLEGYLGVSADTLKVSGAMTVGAAGVYEHARNGGSLPVASWQTGSTLLLTGITGNAPANGRQTYDNIVWNCPSQTSSLNLGWHGSASGDDTTIQVNGDISVLSTGTGRWQFCAPPAGSAGAHSVARVDIAGNVSVSGGATLTAIGSSNAYTDIYITVNGNVSVRDSLSQLSISRGSQGGTGTTTWILKGDSVYYGPYTVNRNSTDPTSGATSQGKFVFAKSGTQYVYVDSTNGWTGECNMFFGDSVVATTIVVGNSEFTGSACTQRIRYNAIVHVGPTGYIGGGTNSNSIPSNFTMENGATLEMESPDGIGATGSGSSGTVRVSGTRDYGTAANFEYLGAVPQTTGSGLPSTVHNLNIQNGAGVTLDSTAMVTVGGLFELTSGVLTTGSNVVAVGAGGTISRTSGHVNGNLQENVATGSGVVRTFDIGDVTNYTPVVVTFASVGTSGDLLGSTTAGDHPQIGTSAIVASKSVNRYYTLTNSGIVFTTYDAVFNFVAGDVDGGAVPANFEVERYSGGNWFDLTEGTKTSTSTEVTGVTSFSDFAIGETGVVTHTITATAGPNGSIDPSGAVLVADGVGQSFTFTPSTGYHVDSIYVDDAYAGDSSHYDFTGVVTDHAIYVTFAINTYTLTAGVVGGGSVGRDPDQANYDHGTGVELTATPVLGWLFNGWSGDTTSSENPITIVMDANKNVTATFVEDPVYLTTYRSFRPDSIALDKDTKGKVGKFIKRKPDKVYFKYEIVVPIQGTTGENFHLEFSMNAVGAISKNYGADTLATFGPGKKFDFVFSPPLDSLTIIQIEGVGLKGKPVKAKHAFGNRKKQLVTEFIMNDPKLPMPNRVNMLFETFEQGGFAATNGLLIGRDRTDSLKKYGWLLSQKYTDVLKTLSKKGVLHTGSPKGFDTFTSNGKPLVKRQKYLAPDKFNNTMLADMVALKVNIAASALEKTPAGFGELIYNDGSSPFNGMMLKDIAAYGDTLMMGYYDGLGVHQFASSEAYAELDSIISLINSSFEGPVDTVDFAAKLHLKGTKPLIDVPYLKANAEVPPTIIAETRNPVAQVPDAYTLYQNYPNPFNPTTTISFDLPEQAFVTLTIYNVLGQEVATLLSHEQMDDGTQEVQFNAGALASGVYFYRIVAQAFDEADDETPVATGSKYVDTGKMLLLK